MDREPMHAPGAAVAGGDRAPQAWLGRVGLAVFALAVYLPILAADPGKVVGDTKTYLYLDPSRFLARVSSLWDPKFALGTLSHQTIGYLFPMGPYYWLLEEVLGVPAWVAQRLWLATIVMMAGLGVRYLLRTLGVPGAGTGVAMLAYAFTPYVLGYSSIYSVLLLPWAALPWWVGFAERGLRRGGWKYAALFALTVQVVGSVNGSALLFVALAPALWVPFSVVGLHTATWRQAWSLVWRTGLLTVLTSLWWLVALVVEGRTSINILRFTESIEVVSATSLPFEIVRGLGNWFVYGGDSGGYWVAARPYFTQRAVFVLVSLLVPTLAMLAAGTIRWRVRAYFALLVVLGVVIAVGAAPYDAPSPVGSVYKSFALESTLGFALRNTGRAVPLVVLGLAVLLGAGVRALMGWLRERGRPRLAVAAAGAVMLLCVVSALPAVLLAGYFSDNLEREEIPGYWRQAIAALDARPSDTRVLALPGSDFATYRWGDTREPIEPGLMDRPYVARELVPWGSPQSLNLLSALDRRVQERAMEPDALAPIARLMGVGDVLLRLDLQTDRYSLVPAGVLWRTFTDPVPEGLGSVERFGSRIPGRLRGRELEDFTLPVADQPRPPPVAVLSVEDPVPIVRAKSRAAPIVVAGDAEGLLDLAAAGLLDADRLVLYSAPYEHDAPALRSLPDDAMLVLTDSNRRRGTRWSGLHDNSGYTEQAGEEPLRDDPSDQRLNPFPDSTDAARTVVVLKGVASVRATGYGEPAFGFSPEQRPAMALDGDVQTAWTVGARSDPRDERIEIVLDEPITTDHLNLVQFSGRLEGQSAPPKRSISEVTMRFDGADEVRRSISLSSRERPGQTVHFPRRTFTKLEIRIDALRGRATRVAQSKNPVGWSEIRLADDRPGAPTVQVEEITRMPVDLLEGLGRESAAHPLAIVMTRESTSFARQFSLPTARFFTLSGTATLGALATDAAIDRALGLPDASAGGLTAGSTGRLGPPPTRASSAFDEDLETGWQTPIGTPRKSIRFRTAAPIVLDRLDLRLMADGRHSLPTRLAIRAGDGPKQFVDVPAQPTEAPGGVVSVPLTFPALRGERFTVKIEKVDPLKRNTLVMPVGIAELGVAGVRRAALPESMPDTCLRDLVAVDGDGVGVRVSGTTADALAGRALTVVPCSPGTPLELGAGSHLVGARKSARNPLGIDVARLVLASGSGGVAAPLAELAAAPLADTRAPQVRILHEGRSSMALRVSETSAPFWLVLGQSQNDGWVARVDGKSLGRSELVDGFANGWLVRPTGNGPLTVTLEWEPQRAVRVALAISAAAALVAVGIVTVAFARHRRLVPADGPPAASAGEPALAPAAPRIEATTAGMVGTVVGCAVAAGVTVRPWVGLGVGAMVLLAIRSRPWRLALRLTPAALMLGVALYISVTQFFERYPPRFDWVAYYDAARIPTWIGILLLGADAVIDLVQRGKPPPGDQVEGP
ncbi:MAG: DUF3367 domain-containing protein [Actinobacteria bacterium]|nr:DUF3367 domain-containing protein [Actinomycetota bacterium]